VSLAALLLAALLTPPGAAPTPASPSATPAGPRLALEPARFDFGDVLPGRRLTKEFTLRNVGSAELVIGKLSSSCACAAALLDDKQRRLAPGHGAALRVTLRTPATGGRVAETVRVASNDPERPELELTITADVKPAR
jgi:hypothetical protein